MEQIIFRIQGSMPDPYVVTFIFADGVLASTCNCKAGSIGQVCKHRLNILSGSREGIASPNADDITQIARWLQGTELQTALREFCDAEVNVDKAKKSLSSAKQRLARFFSK